MFDLEERKRYVSNHTVYYCTTYTLNMLTFAVITFKINMKIKFPRLYTKFYYTSTQFKESPEKAESGIVLTRLSASHYGALTKVEHSNRYLLTDTTPNIS